MGLVGVMERQKSFSFNQPTRLLVFSFTLFSTLLFLFLLLPSVFTYAPSSSPGAHLRIPPPPSPETANVTSFLPELPVKQNSILAPAPSPDSTRNASDARERVFSGKRNPRISSVLEDARRIPSANESVVRSEEMVGGVTVTGVEKGPAFTPAGSRDSSDNVLVKEAGTVDASGCDVSRGSWVWDESYPLYSNRTCSFIDEGFDCQTNGRVDRDYMKWRWQPHDCSIPRYFPFLPSSFFQSYSVCDMLKNDGIVQ